MPTGFRQLRRERPWNQAELAEKLGVHRKQVSAYERGVHASSTDILTKLAEAFDVTLDYLAAPLREAFAKVRDNEDDADYDRP